MKTFSRLRPLFYGIAALLLVALLLLEAFDASAKDLTLQAEDRLREVAITQAGYIRQALAEQERSARAFLPQAESVSADPGQLSTVFSAYRENCAASDVFLLAAGGSTFYGARSYDGAAYLEKLPGGFFSADTSALFSPAEDGLEPGFCLAVPAADDRSAAVLVYDGGHAQSLFDARSFSGAGYLHLFRPDGRFIMRSDAAPSEQLENNLYAALSRVGSVEGGPEQLSAAVNDGETGFLRYNTPFDAGRIAYYAPLGVSDWYILSVVPATVMNGYLHSDQKANTLLMLKCVAVFVAFLFLVWFDLRASACALEKSEKRLAIAASHAANVIFEYEPATKRCVVLQGQFERLPRVKAGSEFPLERYLRHIHPDDAAAVAQLQQELFQKKDRVSATMRFRDFDGKDAYRWFSATLTPVMDKTGVIVSALGTLEDINDEYSRTLLLENRALHDQLTGLINRQQFIALVDQTLAAFTDSDSAAMLLLDLDCFKEVNDAYGHNVGDRVLTATSDCLQKLFRESDYIARYGGDEFVVWLHNVSHTNLIRKKSDALQTLIDTASRELYVSDIPLSASIGAVLAHRGDTFETLFPAADAAMYAAKNSGGGRCVFAPGSEEEGGFHAGDTAAAMMAGELRGLDPLTGIYNKRGFYGEAARMLRLHPETRHILLVFDIYRFKIINELFGEAKGDEVLRKLSSLFVHYLAGTGGVIGRLEADCFALCAPHRDDQAMQPFLDRLSKDTRSFLPGYELIIYFGLYDVDDPTLPPLSICDRALLALNSVKGDYNHRYAVYNDRVRERILIEQQVTNDMTAALENGEFDVYLQPVFSLAEGRFVAAEALVRWFHPVNGAVLPSVFIPIFEKNGFITTLDRFVWERVCKLLRGWLDEELPVLPISVNVSAVNINNSDFTRDIAALVKKYGLDPSLLRLELTESAYAKNADEIADIVSDLQAQGFLVYMDDFGSGYSSFSMLNDVGIDTLKIDMRFLQNYAEVPRTKTILTSIVRMAKWLHLSVIAEGVETKAQADFLHSIGCPLVQGYFYSKPLPVREYTTILLNYGHKADVERASIEFGDFDMNALMASDPRMEILWNNMLSGMGIYELSEDHLELLQANHAYFEIMQLDAASFRSIATDIIHFVSPEDREPLLAACRRATDSDAAEHVQVRRYLPDGRTIVVEVRVRFLGWSGDVAELCFTVDDVTERKQLEEMRFLQQFGNAAKDLFTLVFDFDETGGQVNIVVQQADLTVPERPLSFSETVAWYESRFVDPAWVDAHRAFFSLPALLRRFRAGEDRLVFEYACNFRDGVQHWLSATVVALERQRYICYLTDVTVRKLADAALERERALERAEQDRATALRLQQSVLRGIPGGIASFTLQDGRWNCTYINDSIYPMLGVCMEDADVDAVTACLPAEIWTYGPREGASPIHTYTFHHVKPDGAAVWIRTSATALPGEGGGLINFVMFTDITENVLEQMDRNAYFERLQLLEQAAKSLYFDISIPEDRMEYTRRKDGGGVEKYVVNGYRRYIDACTLIHPDDRALYLRTADTLLSAPVSGHAEYRARYGDDGRFRWYRTFYASLADESGRVYRAIGRMDDIEIEKRSQYLAECDPVSGLYNRCAFDEKFEQYIARAGAADSCALLVIDLDDFSAAAGEGGEARGRALVQDLAAMLSENLGSNALAGHFGGDEFCVLLAGSALPGATAAANAIIRKFAALTQQKYGKAYTCSIGISFCAGNELPNNLSMYREGVYALYQSKAEGKNCCHVYTGAPSAAGVPQGGSASENAEAENGDLSSQAGLAEFVLDRLSRTENVRACIGEMLSLIGARLNVSRVYLFEDTPDGLYCRNTSEWCNAGVQSKIDVLARVPYAQLGDYYANFSEHDIFFCPNVAELAEPLRAILETQGIRSVLQCAIRRHGARCGFLGFDECSRNWLWTKKQVEILTSIARIIGAFLCGDSR